MSDLLISVLDGIGRSVWGNMPIVLALMALFTLLSFVVKPCNPGRPWWRKSGLAVDLCYWFIGPLISSVMISALITIAIILVSSADPQTARDFIENGRGPLSRLPFWWQVAAYLLLSDLILYVSHRFYHGRHLWSFHAIHHSSHDLDWTSATRFHPGNVLFGAAFAQVCMVVAGIAPDVLIATAPFNALTGALVHANLNWTFGPFRYVFASPVFHRWHHTAADRGGSKNFASTFPFIDLAFGTFYMPEGELPDAFGVDDTSFPEDLMSQMLYPWKRRVGRPGDAATADDGDHA